MLDGLMEEDGGPRVPGVHVFECTGARLLVLNAVLRVKQSPKPYDPHSSQEAN